MKEMPGRSVSFDPVADDYDRTRVIPGALREDIARLCAREARLSEGGGLFLDAGVGTGRFAEPLTQIAPGRVVGVDLSAAMMAQAREKAAPGSLLLTQADLQRLPFREGAFSGALMVHILHLIERWPLALDEMRRVLAPRRGVLLLGSEQGSRSRLVEHYYGRARALSVLAPPLGMTELSQAVAYLRRSARVEQLSAPYLTWKRSAPIQDTLRALNRRTYSQMWRIPDESHAQMLAETQDFAVRTFGSLSAVETLDARFVLYTARWN